MHLRSLLERSYAEWLDRNNVRFRYEPCLFQLSSSKYLPDFYLIDTNEWIEVKGRLTKRALRKYEEFKVVYPNEKISLIGPPEINILRKKMMEIR